MSLLIVDTSYLIHRAYYGGTRGDASSWTKSLQKKCVQWVISWIKTAMIKSKSDKVFCAFDGASPFRLKYLASYKSSRGGSRDADFNGKPCYDIIEPLKKEFDKLEWSWMHEHVYEGDDLITTAAYYYGIVGGRPTTLFCKDKDLRVVLAHKKMRMMFKEDEKPKSLEEFEVVGPHRGYDYNILIGDDGDDVPAAECILSGATKRRNKKKALEFANDIGFVMKNGDAYRNVEIMTLRIVTDKNGNVYKPSEAPWFSPYHTDDVQWE